MTREFFKLITKIKFLHVPTQDTRRNVQKEEENKGGV